MQGQCHKIGEKVYTRCLETPHGLGLYIGTVSQDWREDIHEVSGDSPHVPGLYMQGQCHTIGEKKYSTFWCVAGHAGAMGHWVLDTRKSGNKTLTGVV